MSAVKDRELITVFRPCPESLVLRKLIRDMRTGEYPDHGTGNDPEPFFFFFFLGVGG